MPARPNGLGVRVRQGVQDEVLQGRELEVQQRDRREGARVQMSSDQPAGQEAVLVILSDGNCQSKRFYEVNDWQRKY